LFIEKVGNRNYSASFAQRLKKPKPTVEAPE